MSDPKPSVKFSPRRPLTHNELIIDFVDFPANEEFNVRITGPNPQPYWTTLKADDIGQAQLIWRTQAGGDYKLETKGSHKLSEDFEVFWQAGEREMIDDGRMAFDADVKTVEEPGNMGDTPSREMRAPDESDNPAVDDPAFAEAKGPSEKKTSKGGKK